MQFGIGTLDLIVIVVYLVGIVGLGCWVGLRHRRQGGESKDYFLAGGTLTWPVIGLALFSTNISTVHLVSLAQEGYANGLAFGNFELMAGFTLILLALFFAPFYIRSRVATLPDFLERRYSRASRDWLAFISIVSAIFIHIGFTLYTAALVMHGLLGIPEEYLLWTIIAIAGMTGLYTAIGGLIAVVTTEAIQTVVLLLGAVCVTVIALVESGGWSGIRETLGGQRRTGQAHDAAFGRRPRRPAVVRRLPGLPGDRDLVLVHGPDDRPARAGGQERGPCPHRRAVRGLHQDPARVHSRPAGTDVLCARPAERLRRPGAARFQRRLLVHDRTDHAARPAWRGGRSAVGRGHEHGLRGVELGRHALLVRPVQTLGAGRCRSTGSSWSVAA